MIHVVKAVSVQNGAGKFVRIEGEAYRTIVTDAVRPARLHRNPRVPDIAANDIPVNERIPAIRNQRWGFLQMSGDLFDTE